MKHRLILLLSVLAMAIPVVGVTSSPALAMNDPGQESYGCGGHSEWQCDPDYYNAWDTRCYEVWVRDC